MSRDVEVPVGMLDPHYPECYAVTHRDRGDDRCICPALRACEQRVLEGRPDPGISEKQAIANHAIYRNGYAAGVQAARDAVAARAERFVNPETGEFYIVKSAALAAIDALKGDANG